MPPKNPAPTNKVKSPEALLDMLTAQAHNKAYDVAMGLSAQFVNSLIRAGNLPTIEQAIAKLYLGNSFLQPNIEKELIAMSLGEIQATLPKEPTPIPGVTPNVPAKA